MNRPAIGTGAPCREIAGFLLYFNIKLVRVSFKVFSKDLELGPKENRP